MCRITRLRIRLHEGDELSNDELDELVRFVTEKAVRKHKMGEGSVDDLNNYALSLNKGKKINFLHGANGDISKLYEEVGDLKQALIEERKTSEVAWKINHSANKYFTPKIEAQAVSKSNRQRASNAGRGSADSRKEKEEANIQSIRDWLTKNNYSIEEERNRKDQRPYSASLLEHFKHREGFSKSNIYRLLKKI